MLWVSLDEIFLVCRSFHAPWCCYICVLWFIRFDTRGRSSVESYEPQQTDRVLKKKIQDQPEAYCDFVNW